MCILLTGADMEGARPRKTVTVRMAKFDRFLLFSASLEKHLFDKSGHWPKTAEIDQGAGAKVVGSHLPPTLSDSVTQIESGL